MTEENKRFYIQERETVGDGFRVIWTSESFTRAEADKERKELTENNLDETWFVILRDFQ